MYKETNIRKIFTQSEDGKGNIICKCGSKLRKKTLYYHIMTKKHNKIIKAKYPKYPLFGPI